MARLHPELRSGLALLPSHTPVALLTRHSVREETKARVATYDLPLTAEGVLLAEQWGRELPRPVTGYWSSPVGRCVDTAKAMARGIGHDLDIESSALLVEPGCFVHSIRHVGPLFLQLGPVAFANKHLNETLPGILSPREGVAKLLQHLQDCMGGGESFSVHVTHDTILAAFVYALEARTSLQEDDWPWMMEGVYVWFDGGSVHWIWRGVSRSRPLEELR